MGIGSWTLVLGILLGILIALTMRATLRSATTPGFIWRMLAGLAGIGVATVAAIFGAVSWADAKVAECQALPDASGCQDINIVVGLAMLCGLGAAAAFATLGAGIRFWPGRGRT